MFGYIDYNVKWDSGHFAKCILLILVRYFCDINIVLIVNTETLSIVSDQRVRVTDF